MEITYGGGASFTLKGEVTVLINPGEEKPTGALLLHSTVQKRSKQIVNGPGEYEIRGAMIATTRLGARTSTALAHAVHVDRLTVVHLDAHIDALSEEAVEAFGRVDVLMVRADDPKAAQAAIQTLLPRVALPYGSHAAELCAALGVSDAQPQAKFSWNGINAAPKAVLLKAPSSRKRVA
jgi:hypothetical protein